MPFTNTQQKLEAYFAKHYTKKYVAFGAQYYKHSNIPFCYTPMQKYFFSGQYKELNDTELNELWSHVNRERKSLKNISVILFIVILICEYFSRQ